MMNMLFSFNGRIRRTNYWLAAIGSGLALTLIFVVILMLVGGAGALAAGAAGGSSGAANGAGAGIGIVGILLMLGYFVLLFWISLALQIKRWHDRDKSAVWVLINFIPFVGAVWSLVECGFMDGTQGPNKYGPSPKGIAGPAPTAAAA
jgi:uncharacterized membrane protein YhaH (DUF805 family)